MGQRGGAIGSGGGSSLSAQPKSTPEESFTPWSRFVSANEEVSKREADKLSSGVKGQVDAAVKGRTDASNAQAGAIQQNYTKSPTQAFGSFADAPPPKDRAQAPSSFGAASSFGSQQHGQPERPALAPPSAPPQQRAPSAVNAGRPDSGLATLSATPEAPAVGGIDPDRLKTDVSSGAPKTSGYGLTGGKDLEGQLGAEAWGKLVGDTQKAQDSANALGTTEGVEALLQQGAPAPNSAFDAALIGGAGGEQFRDMAKQFGGDKLTGGLLDANESAMGAWQKLMGDVQAAGAARDAEIGAATDDMNAKALAAEAATQLDADTKKKAADAKNWLEEKFPVPEVFKTQDSLLDWVEDNRHGGTTGYSNLRAWAEQIYGDMSQESIDRLYADLRRMTPEEYEAFKYGLVPEWMGNGSKASGFNGGAFFGLGPTGSRYSLETTGKATAENQKFWSEWRAALEVFYQVLAAVAAAAATAAGGPVVGGAVAAGLEAALSAEKAATSGGAELGEEQ